MNFKNVHVCSELGQRRHLNSS